MNKFISTILTLAILIIANSCREQDDTLTSTIDDTQNHSTYKRNGDTIKTDTVQVNNILVEGDPPPKNGHQW